MQKFIKKKTVHPELSVIVPVLNEAAALPVLFRNLSEQMGTSIELIVSDGGSTDGSADLARRLGNDAIFPVTVTAANCGRGKQLNSGVATSRCSTLLFLHADSRLVDPQALRTALDLLTKAITLKEHDRIAGHFALRFVRRDPSPSVAFYFYECKARLNRRECTHGDQGFMMRRTFFYDTGPFDESLPMLAETRFAEAVRKTGEWLLFPAEILTSARRFESEGFYARQVLNAIIMNFASIGWETFFHELPSIYVGHHQSGRIALAPLLQAIRRLMASLPLRERLFLWYATGAYVQSHSWQIPFFLDTHRKFRRGIPAGGGNSPLLDFHDHYLYRLTDNLPGRLAATTLTWLWFRLTFIYASVTKQNSDERAIV